MDDDELEEYAEEWGISVDDVEAIFDAVDVEAYEGVPLDENGRPDADYMEALAEQLDIDIHDLYEMYYGYTE